MLSILELALKYAPELADLLKGEKAGEVAARALEKATGARETRELTGAEEQAFRMALLGAEGELRKLAYRDIAGARRRDLEVRRLNGGENVRANLMILGDVLGLLACLAAMVYTTWLGVDSGGEASPAIMALNGPLGMLTQQFAICLRDAHQFEFGSSRGSRLKDEKELLKGGENG